MKHNTYKESPIDTTEKRLIFIQHLGTNPLSGENATKYTPHRRNGYGGHKTSGQDILQMRVRRRQHEKGSSSGKVRGNSVMEVKAAGAYLEAGVG